MVGRQLGWIWEDEPAAVTDGLADWKWEGDKQGGLKNWVDGAAVYGPAEIRRRNWFAG